MDENKYLKTGFYDFDMKLGGLAKGNVILMGGRPCMGKTAFAVSLVANVCQRNEGRCVYYSADVELPVSKLVARFVSARMGTLALDGVSDESIVEDEMQKFNLTLLDDYNENIDYKLEHIIKEVENEPVVLVVIDGLQKLCSDGSGYMDKSKIRTVLKMLKTVAINNHCPILITSELDRTADTRKDHRPDIKDICGLINPLDEVDDILLIMREEYYINNISPKDVAEITHISRNSDEVIKVELQLLRKYALFFSK